MATATFGRRNIAHSASAARPSASAAPRRPEAASLASDINPHNESAERAVTPDKAGNIRIGALVLIGCGLLLAFFFFPDLRREASLQDTFRPDFNVVVERANCRRYIFVVTHCSLQFSWQDGAGRSTASSSFLVGLKWMGGTQVIPMRSAADPSVVTSAIAVESLSNRICTLILAPGLCLLIGVLMLVQVRSDRA